MMPSIFRTPRKEKQVITPQKPKSFSVPSREKAGDPVSPQREVLTEFGQLQSTPRNGYPIGDLGFVTAPQRPLSPTPLLPPKLTFAPTRIPPTTFSTSNSIDSFSYSNDESTSKRQYGILGGIGARVTLSLEDVGAVIRDVGKELLRRGLTIPLLFSNQALELSAPRTKMLIQSYLDALRSGQSGRYDTWKNDLSFAKEHELAWMLRWSLSRIVRIREGTREICHGLLEWEVYEEWRGRERVSNYPIDAFPYLAALVPREVYNLVISPLLSLLSRFAAHSHLSGLTPHALSSLFAPLFFDIPTSSPCMVAHSMFIRAACATEHLLLSYIRSTSKGEGLGVTDLPGRLREWVKGYPAMVASDADLSRAVPRRGARTVRCERISRTVRAYSQDLIASAETWNQGIPKWEAWDRVVLKSQRGEPGRPKFSASWRRKIGVRDSLPLPNGSSSSSGEVIYGRAKKPSMTEKDNVSRKAVGDEDEARWGSLAGKEWGLFEEGGFDSPTFGAKKEGDMRTRLQFDLTESAKLTVSQRRQTMDWTEFASPSGGFNRTDPVLDVSLSFSSPLSTSISNWPKERDDLTRRLHKTQKEATPFHYDTTPRIGVEIEDSSARPDQHGRVFVEEAFVDAWADWMMGGAWVDRDELTFKEANWALIEYKARPSRPEELFGVDPRADPRTSDLFFLFEERVPLEYQVAVADPKEKKTFATLFSTNKKKRADPLPNRMIRSGSGWDDSDFDRMLLHRERTKKMTMSKSEPGHAAIWNLNQGLPDTPLRNSLVTNQTPIPRTRTKSNEYQRSGELVEGKGSFFSKSKDRVVRRVKTDEANREKARIQREREVDFEIHSASGISSPDNSPNDGAPMKQRNKDRGDEKWMDILIAHGARRMDRQDAALPARPPHRTESGIPPHSGLPSSPHPPHRALLEPVPVQLDHHDIDPYAQYSDPAPLEHTHTQYPSTEYTHSPETSGSTDGHEIRTPHGNEGADVQRWPSAGKRKAVPALTTPSPPAEPREDYDPRGSLEEGLVPPIGERPVSREYLSPTPQRDARDTIHNIVDTYRDSMTTESTDFTDDAESAHERDSDHLTEVGMVPAPMTEAGSVRQKALLWEEKFAAGKGRGEEADRDGVLTPPAPLFDLTPGREPSPARYKHGEPLQFVGEEDEEEEY